MRRKNHLTASQSPRAQILESAKRIFRSADQAHGLKHALQVDQLALEVAREPEFVGVPIDATVLSAAAMLHDSGHAGAHPSWSSDRIEHIEAGVQIAKEVLQNVAPFDTDADRLRQVCYLILHHDRTNYSFPIKARGGEPAQAPVFRERSGWPYVLSHEKTHILPVLAILKEADALMGTGTAGAQRTVDYSQRRGVPLFAEGNPLNAWMWEESAVGNARLAAKRALLDAFTGRGKEMAWQGYLETEEVIRQLAEQNDVPYLPEVHLSDLHDIAAQPADDTFRINRVQSWEQLVDTLRCIELRGDARLRPYEEATVQSRLVEIDSLCPTAYYVLNPQLDIGTRLRQRFLASYALDPFDLSGIVDLSYGGEECQIAPPLVEVYTERRGPLKGKRVRALVDGLHRCVNARSLGFSRIRAVVISGIPEHLPLVPLPLRWDDVRHVDDIAEEAQKRAYRFPDIKSFPDVSWFSSAPVTSRNCRYFFYRDLRPLGSSGIRRVGTTETP